MKKDKHKTKISKEVDKLPIVSEQHLQQLLIERTDEKADKIHSNENLDREILKIQLIGGEEIDLSKLGVFSFKIDVYSPRIPQEFYRQVFRLNADKGWTIPKGKIIEKPNIVGKWTKEIIYNRFDKRVLPALEHLNPYERIGIRRLKHFQLLNEDGLQKFDRFVNEAIEVMKECSDWYSFRVMLHKVHGVPYQTDLFK